MPGSLIAKKRRKKQNFDNRQSAIKASPTMAMQCPQAGTCQLERDHILLQLLHHAGGDYSSIMYTAIRLPSLLQAARSETRGPRGAWVLQ